MRTDFIIKLEMGGKQVTFKLKDRPLKIVADGYFSLNNKAVVVMYKSSIYLIFLNHDYDKRNEINRIQKS